MMVPFTFLGTWTHSELLMTDTTLFIWPGTCARVTAIALEAAGVSYDMRLVRLMEGEHKSPDFLAINPKAKVPALRVGEWILTENVAILSYLNENYPDARLLPEAQTPEARAEQVSDLAFCAATLHPIVSRMGVPHMFASPLHKDIVWQKGAETMQSYFALIEKRFTDQPWWYGESWSVMDGYLSWILERCTRTGFDVSAFPAYSDHFNRCCNQPAVSRAMAREAALLEGA